MPKHILSIDLETFSPIDLKSAGAYKYAEKVEILLFAYSLDGGPVQCIDLTKEKIPKWLLNALTDEAYLKTAWNAAFERSQLNAYFKIYTPPEQWHCNLVKAAIAGLPLSLEKASEALGLEQKKDRMGHVLIRYFCIPCKPTKLNGMRERNYPSDDPVKWQQFINYCKQDVVTEMAVAAALSWFTFPKTEHKLWCLDQKCNERGIAVDLDLIRAAIILDAAFREDLLAQAVEITGLDNANSVAQLKKWLSEEIEEDVVSLTKGAVSKLLARVDNDRAKKVLELRALLSKSSIKKYQAMINAVCSDGRIRGLFQFYGANRTGRDAGRLIQPQNLARIKMSDGMLDCCREAVKAMDKEFVEMCFTSLPDALSQLIRTALIPGKDVDFFVSDLAAIEARMIAWLAGEQWVLDVFTSHGKIYEATAAKMFNIPIESIEDPSDMRQRGKVAALALSYQGGVNALIAMGAVDQGIPEEDLKPIVDAWRLANPNIVKFWYELDRKAKHTLRYGNESIVGDKGIRFVMRNKNLLMYLPCGRFLCYHGAHLREVYTLKGKILGYTAKSLLIAGFNLSRSEIQWIQRVDIPILAEEEKYSKEQLNQVYESPSHGFYTLADLLVLKEIQFKEMILFYAVNQKNNKWELSSTYGGKLAENATQAASRDVMMYGVLCLEEAGYNIVLRVHDETASERPVGEGSIEEVNKLMTKNAPWMKGLPLKAKGAKLNYYQK